MAASYHSPCWLIISCVAVVIRDHCETSQRGWQTDKHFPHLKTTNNIHHISWKSNVWSKYELLKFYSRPNEISREKRSNFPLRSNKTIWPNLTIVKMWTLGLSRGRNISRLYHLDGLAMILFQEGTPKVKRRMEHNFFFGEGISTEIESFFIMSNDKALKIPWIKLIDPQLILSFKKPLKFWNVHEHVWLISDIGVP